MKKLTMIALLFCAAAQMAAAQNKQDAKQAREEIRKEMAAIRAEQKEPVNALLSASDVGEPDSFGKGVKFLGTARTGVVYVYRSCDTQILHDEVGVTLEPNDVCFVNTVGGPSTSGTFLDLGRITIPGRSADNVIYFVINRTISNNLENNYANDIPVSFRFTPRLTIESAALNDPAAVDPTTGAPLKGVLTVAAFGTKSFFRSLHAGASEFFDDQSSSAAATGFSRSYFEAIGLPPSVIGQLYRQPMTIKLGMTVSARNVALGQYLYSMRFMGN